jgi:hypothetical protein
LYRWSLLKDKSERYCKEDANTMGGEKNYNAAHFIQWDFVNRKPSWDKMDGVMLRNPSANQVILVNINTLKGKVYENGTLVTDENKANALLEKGRTGSMMPTGL